MQIPELLLLRFGVQIPELLTRVGFGMQIPELLAQRNFVSSVPRPL